MLRLKVTEKEYQETQKVRDAWSQRAATGRLQYDLWEMNCIDFTARMVQALSDQGSSIQIPPHASAQGPLTYLEALYELNEANLVSVADFAVACP